MEIRLIREILRRLLKGEPLAEKYIVDRYHLRYDCQKVALPTKDIDTFDYGAAVWVPIPVEM